jgi:integrase
MASIRRRTWRTASGEARESWQLDFVDQTGKRRHKQFQRKKDADAELVKLRAQVADGVYTPESASAAVGEAIAGWLARAATDGLERGTAQQYRQHANAILKLIDGKLKLAKLTRARCEQLRDDLLNAHSRELSRKILVSFKSALRDARRRGLMVSNPAAETTIEANKRQKRRLKAGVDFPFPAEVSAMSSAADPRSKAMVALAARAGLRISEIRALSWDNVDLSARTVTVAERADKWSTVGSPKSDGSRRTVPLSAETVQVLREWKLAQPGGRKLCFGTRSDKPDLLGNLTRSVLKPLIATAGVPSYGWHSLRHYAISAWLASRIDPKTVQTWAGHSNLTMTLDTYGHMIPRDDDHARIEAAELALLAT